MTSPDTPALRDPRLAEVSHRVVTHERAGSLEEAARLRGLQPGAVIKTMVVRRGEDDFVFVLVPGDRVIDWAKLRTVLGERRLSMPGADEALAVTGYVRGTITPLGAARPWPVIADQRLARSTVSIGGGARGVSVSIDGTDLIEILAADSEDVTKLQSA